MSAPRASSLLAAPFGRQVVFGRLGFNPEQALFDALGLGQVPGAAPLVPLGSRWRPARARRRWQDVPAAEAAAALRDMVARDDWRALPADQASLLAELAQVSVSFGFSGTDEAVWGLTGLAPEALLPVAEALLAAPGARSWLDPVDRRDQRHVQWHGQPLLTGDAVGQAIWDTVAREREQNTDGLAAGPREREPGVRYGGYWWSGPSYTRTWTSAACPGVPALDLLHWFDGPPRGWEGRAMVWSMVIDPAARVAEITGPDDWRDLVSQFPRDVTGTHDGEWRDWGGQPGPWRLPDWPAAARRYDGVHVTVGGFLATSGLALPAAGGFTMLAGWVPGATLWLRDAAVSVTPAGTWHGDQDGSDSGDLMAGWQPA